MQEIKGNIRQQLYGFYIAYNLWLRSGAKPGGVFSQNYGLCASLFDYLTLIGAPCEEALEQLHIDFRSAGLNEALPFNESKRHYHEERGHNMCHMNPARVAWVRAQMVQAALTVPAEMDVLTCHPDGVAETYAEGRNACRAAMFNGTGDLGKQVRELTMLVKQLVSQLKKVKPDCKLPDKAMDYLKRNGLISVEDILR